MIPFTNEVSRLIPILAANVDTDQIIPAQLVNVQGQAALADALFANVRREDPGFVLNRPYMRGRTVVLAGPNFGCGSSREAAAWALGAAGVRALIGPSFNDTFFSNCTKNGIVPIVAPAHIHAHICDIVARKPDVEVSIDLVAGRVALVGEAIAFEPRIDPFVRDLLVRGIDELEYLLDRCDVIAAFEASRANAGSLPPSAD
jgi:3-isopropylmalate/(R)-2-methylmalate dehydratase small subunit